MEEDIERYLKEIENTGEYWIFVLLIIMLFPDWNLIEESEC